MATFQYSELKTKIERRWIDSNAAVTAETLDLVNEAIKKIQERYNFKCMEATVEYTTVDATRLLNATPTDWKEPRGRPWVRYFDGGNKEIDWLTTHDDVVRLYSINDANHAGEPKHLFLDENQVNIDVYPFPGAGSDWGDDDFRVNVPYWKYLADLAVDGDSNWFTNNAADYIIAYAVGEGFLINWDEQRGAMWAQKAQNEMRTLIDSEKRKKTDQTHTLIPRRNVRGTRSQRGFR